MNNKLKIWMKNKENLSDRTVSRYIGTINKIGSYFNEDLFKITDIEKVRALRDRYFKIKIWIQKEI